MFLLARDVNEKQEGIIVAKITKNFNIY